MELIVVNTCFSRQNNKLVIHVYSSIVSTTDYMLLLRCDWRIIRHVKVSWRKKYVLQHQLLVGDIIIMPLLPQGRSIKRWWPSSVCLSVCQYQLTWTVVKQRHHNEHFVKKIKATRDQFLNKRMSQLSHKKQRFMLEKNIVQTKIFAQNN